MRIRKNAKLSPLLFSSSSASSSFSQGGSVPVETFQTHVCQLNQSPWDVIPFDSDSIQFEGAEDSFTNGSAGDSLGAVESVASLMDTEDNKPGIIEDVAMIALNDNHDINLHAKKVVVVNNNGYKGLGKNSCCNAMDAKGWPCKNGVKHGQSFCHHHLSLLRSHNNNGSIKKTPAAAAATTTTGSRRARPRAAATKKGSGSGSGSKTNPNEFYYYSGFGPLWGKRRGDKNGEASKNSVGENSTMLESDDVNVKVVAADNVVVVAANNDVVTSSEIDNVGFDFVDDDEDEDCDDDDDDDDNGKKRMRKPVKERSLKSLM